MPAVRLTDRYIRSLKCPPNIKRLDYADTGCPNLMLRVMPSGKKTFSFRYQIQGKKRRTKIGEFGDDAHQVLLRDARQKSTQILANVLDGEDPAPEAPENALDAPTAITVNDIIEQYQARLKRRGRRESYLYDIKMRMKLHVAPMIGKMPIADVRPSDLAKIFAPLEAAGKATTHNRLLTMMRPLFKLAKVPDPTTEIEKLPEAAKEEWFNLKQLAQIWLALDNPDAKVHPLTANAIRLSMLTLKRANECAGTCLAEIDNGYWRIPAKRMKGRREEVVPLSAPALKLIESTKSHPLRPVDDSGYLFPSIAKPGHHIQRTAMSRAFPRTRREISKLKHHKGTLHSLRHSGATILATNGVSPFIISALLSHALTSAGVAQVTSRYNMYDLLEERHEALETWGELLMAEISKEQQFSFEQLE